MSEPVRPDDRGALVRDLHRRLLAVGHPVDAVEESDGHFGPDTTRALLAFQAERGLDEHGTVDETTQAALVEAGVRLGDRHLYLHAPMFRGDDVADLQLRLGSLGFDAGRIDGIFGPTQPGHSATSSGTSAWRSMASPDPRPSLDSASSWVGQSVGPRLHRYGSWTACDREAPTSTASAWPSDSSGTPVP